MFSANTFVTWCIIVCFYQLNITRDGCGTSKLCVETPDDCDPTANSSCLFTSVVTGTTMAPNGTDLYIGLRGDSEGYIALGLTVNASEVTHTHTQFHLVAHVTFNMRSPKYTVYCPKSRAGSFKRLGQQRFAPSEDLKARLNLLLFPK